MSKRSVAHDRPRPNELEHFLAKYWRRRGHVAPPDGRRLARLPRPLRDPDLPTLLGLADGEITGWLTERETIRVSDPRTALQLWAAGFTLYFHLDRQRREIAELVEQLAQTFQHHAANIRVSVFASRRGSGTSRHVDFNDNLTVQLRGTKRWRLGRTHIGGAKTRRQWIDLVGADQVQQASYQGTPMIVDLEPASVLYCPADWLHETEATSDSLSLNLSFQPYRWCQLLPDLLRPGLLQLPGWDQPALGRWDDAPVTRESLAAFLQLVDGLAPQLVEVVARELMRRGLALPPPARLPDAG